MQTCCVSHRVSLCSSKAGTACHEMAGMLPPQVPICVADAVRDHLLHNCAQLGAGYALSKRADAAVDAAHEVVKARPPRPVPNMTPQRLRLLHALASVGLLT